MSVNTLVERDRCVRHRGRAKQQASSGHTRLYTASSTHNASQGAVRLEMRACMRAAWRRTVHLNHVDHCDATGADVQLILASIELHQPPATRVLRLARSLLLERSFFCSDLSPARSTAFLSFSTSDTVPESAQRARAGCTKNGSMLPDARRALDAGDSPQLRGFALPSGVLVTSRRCSRRWRCSTPGRPH